MKFLFNILLLFFIFIAGKNICAEDFSAEYKVSTRGLTIGELFWNLSKNNIEYHLKIELKSRGLLSSLYKFKGTYVVNGFIENKTFVPKLYSQEWITNKKKKDVQIAFETNKILNLFQKPKEKEFSRIDVDQLRGYSDPLTSFLKLLSGIPESKTIDGRRVYVFSLVHNHESENKKTYIIKNYSNIWADHKRNDLEKISIVSGLGDYFPQAIFINFKGQLFKVLKI